MWLTEKPDTLKDFVYVFVMGLKALYPGFTHMQDGIRLEQAQPPNGLL